MLSPTFQSLDLTWIRTISFNLKEVIWMLEKWSHNSGEMITVHSSLIILPSTYHFPYFYPTFKRHQILEKKKSWQRRYFLLDIPKNVSDVTNANKENTRLDIVLHTHLEWDSLSPIQSLHSTLPPLNVIHPWVLHRCKWESPLDLNWSLIQPLKFQDHGSRG